MAVALEEQNTRARVLADATLRHSLERYIRSKVQASEVDDLVQATLTDALAAPNAPDAPDELRRWVRGIAHHKIVDLYRGRRHLRQTDGDQEDWPSEERAPHSARDLLRWASKELPSGQSEQHTFEWMLREGSGEKLEDIAREQGLPAPRVRQRVSRLRRFLRERWEAQVAAVAAIALLVGAVVLLTKQHTEEPRIVKEELREARPAEAIRKRALERCDRTQWRECLALLDEAAKLDPEGENLQRVRGARAAAESAIATEQPTPRQLAPAPTSSVAPEPTDSLPLETRPAPSSSAPSELTAPRKPAPRRVNPKAVPTAELDGKTEKLDAKASRPVPPPPVTQQQSTKSSMNRSKESAPRNVASEPTDFSAK